MARKALRTCLTWENLSSKPTHAQNLVLMAIAVVLLRIVRAGNQSGKSAVAARDCSWFLNREHPYIDVTAEWGTGPLLTIIAGQDRTQIEKNLWNRGVKPLLKDPTEWRESRPSGQLTSATNKRTGDEIIFISHNNASPDDIKHMQSYAAHYVWLDEMPKNPAVIEELTRRIDAKRGRFLATFTQKVRNDRVRKAVDDLDPSISQLFRLNKYDNPLYADRLDEERAKVAHLSPEVRAAVERGDWIMSSTSVYAVDRDVVVSAPQGYNPGWSHVLVADPATESKLGKLVVASNGEKNQFGEIKWWIVGAEYVEGLYVPSRIVSAVEHSVRHLNVVRRVYDTAASWYRHQAKAMGYDYKPVPDKSNSKADWIAKTQEGLGRWLFVAPWCPLVIDELESCERSETNPDKIANAHRFHLIDCVHYFLATKPPEPPKPKVWADFWEYLHSGNNQRIAAQESRRRRRVSSWR